MLMRRELIIHYRVWIKYNCYLTNNFSSTLDFLLYLSKSASLYSKKRCLSRTRIFSQKISKHKTASLRLKFTVFFSGISKKVFGKALKSALLSKKRFFALISAIMPSKRGHDCLASAIFSHQKLKMRESSFNLILRSVICKLPPGGPFPRHHALQHSSPAPNGAGLWLSETL